MCFNKGFTGPDPEPDTTTPFGRAFYKREASYFVLPYWMVLLTNIAMCIGSSTYWSVGAITIAQALRQLHLHLSHMKFFVPHWYRFGTLYGLIACFFIGVLTVQAVLCMLWVIVTKWLIIGRRKAGPCEWDKSSYCQRWQLHLSASRPLYKGYGNGGVLAPLTGTAFIVWFYRAQGAKIGKNVNIYAGGKAGLMTEPDLVEVGNLLFTHRIYLIIVQLGDHVSLDNCSVVAHINSRGKFALNALKIGNGYVYFQNLLDLLFSHSLPLDVPCAVAQDFFPVLRWRTAVCSANTPFFLPVKSPTLAPSTSDGRRSVSTTSRERRTGLPRQTLVAVYPAPCVMECQTSSR
jgi:hypothetical protein